MTPNDLQSIVNGTYGDVIHVQCDDGTVTVEFRTSGELIVYARQAVRELAAGDSDWTAQTVGARDNPWMFDYDGESSSTPRYRFPKHRMES